MKSRTTAAVIAAALIAMTFAACARHEEHRQATLTHPAGGRNPSDFPVSPRSEVLTVVPVDSAQMRAAIKLSDPHAEVPADYRGNEVILQTGASMKQLTAWVAALKAAPPPGYHLSTSHFELNGNGGPDAQTVAGAQFDTAGAARSVYVVVADPRRLRDQIGPALDLIDNYTNVPSVLRGPIDDQAKKQIGYSVSELLDAKSPVGAAMAALKTLHGTNRRAILLVDETAVR